MKNAKSVVLLICILASVAAIGWVATTIDFPGRVPPNGSMAAQELSPKHPFDGRPLKQKWLIPLPANATSDWVVIQADTKAALIAIGIQGKNRYVKSQIYKLRLADGKLTPILNAPSTAQEGAVFGDQIVVTGHNVAAGALNAFTYFFDRQSLDLIRRSTIDLDWIDPVNRQALNVTHYHPAGQRLRYVDLATMKPRPYSPNVPNEDHGQHYFLGEAFGIGALQQRLPEHVTEVNRYGVVTLSLGSLLPSALAFKLERPGQITLFDQSGRIKAGPVVEDVLPEYLKADTIAQRWDWRVGARISYFNGLALFVSRSASGSAMLTVFETTSGRLVHRQNLGFSLPQKEDVHCYSTSDGNIVRVFVSNARSKVVRVFDYRADHNSLPEVKSFAWSGSTLFFNFSKSYLFEEGLPVPKWALGKRLPPEQSVFIPRGLLRDYRWLGFFISRSDHLYAIVSPKASAYPYDASVVCVDMNSERLLWTLRCAVTKNLLASPFDTGDLLVMHDKGIALLAPE